jgi:hypothetical protein
VGDVTVLLGLFLHRGELTLLVYAALFALAAHLVIVWREEPDLRGRFGAEYDAYVRLVPRWIGPLRPRADRPHVRRNGRTATVSPPEDERREDERRIDSPRRGQ